jgi:TRAP-type C4-dicarboxylate transport system permease small subunit
MEDASRLAYIIILCSMLLLVLLIVKDSLEKTPFTRKNINIVKAISILQLLLGIIPGTVRTVMSQLRFGYSSSLLDEKWVYMIIIAFIIGSIAYVFEKGLDLQEDVDSIV